MQIYGLFSPCPFPNIKRSETPTLDSSLGTDSGSQTHGTGHEVGEDLVRTRALLALVLAEVGDLVGGVFRGGAEGAVERRSDSPLLLAGGDGGAGGGGQLLASANTQHRTGSGGESHDGRKGR